ncbi:MAG: amylo-alpha-1,6-glucosidase [Candidatus Endonucleobacter sp. (ex Gigantidas childressi)]|nr:amylo-alpha-1,6-glucosidase [Candidatus Endonucleobacter sp. (ex Gigantidas childressi)]
MHILSPSTLQNKRNIVRSEALLPLRFGRSEVSNLNLAETREWLVTNGIGGYGSGTIAGSISRGYHGLLVASTKPPTKRRVTLVKLDETLQSNDKSYKLACNRWSDGSIEPKGHYLIEAFELQGSIPCWRYMCDTALIDKRVWMEDGENTTYVSYTLVTAYDPILLTASVVVNNRAFHNTGHVNVPISVNAHGSKAEIIWGDEDSPPLHLGISSGDIKGATDIYRNYLLSEETSRGMRNTDDHVHGATFSSILSIGETLVFAASTKGEVTPDIEALARRWQRDGSLLTKFRAKEQINTARKTPQKSALAPQVSAIEPPAPITWIERLTLAADQFIVSRPCPDQPNGMSIISGYHWLEDRDRDTMISLSGLTLVTGRPEVATQILQTFARFINEGMLPNRFSDACDEPQYNTIDVTLWYFHAVQEYYSATNDKDLLKLLFPVLDEIIQAYVQGTRYGIKVDPADGLLQGGDPEVQLTGIDSKVDGHYTTPRTGKPVEVNALWYNALRTIERFAKILGDPSATYNTLAAQALTGFSRFWNNEKNYCFDVLDGPDGNEDTLRPNQLLAVSLHDSPLQPKQQMAIVDACSKLLLTSRGLRLLTKNSPALKGRYCGEQSSRNSSYHEGTSWGWLVGPFITAHLRVYADAHAARRFLESLVDSLSENGLGTIGEIFDGNPPFTGKGCIAQAWSVGEILRAVDRIESLEAKSSNFKGDEYRVPIFR